MIKEVPKSSNYAPLSNTIYYFSNLKKLSGK